MADVRDLLEHARRRASLAGVPPLPQHPPNSHTHKLQTTAAIEQQGGVHDHDTASTNDTPDVDNTDFARVAPDTAQELMIPAATEQSRSVHEYDTDSSDDTPDMDESDLTWVYPGQGGDAKAKTRAVTRARGRQDGIIHTALLFSYLDL